MSFTECVLQDERPKRPGEFTFTWSIENYNYCPVSYPSRFTSPFFAVEFLGNSKLCLWLSPKGKCEYPGFVSCELVRQNLWSTFAFSLSIRMANGQFKEGGEVIFNSSSNYSAGYSKFVSLKDLEGPNGYLVNGTVTFRCRIWKTDADLEIPASMHCDAHSRIKISKLDYTWILNGAVASLSSPGGEFKYSLDISCFFKEMSELKIHVFRDGNCGASALYFGIEIEKKKKCGSDYFMICLIHLIDASGQIVHTACCQHLFDNDKRSEIFYFPIISMYKFYANKALYLAKGKLSLRYELGFASNEDYLETFAFRQTERNLELQPSTNNPDSDGHELWLKNVKDCYEGGKFSDFIIRTPSRQFPVSKNILCAQSSVFEAMFERDMKERKTGIVDIEDLDDDTVSLMLIFVYTNAVDVIDFSTALKLYFAADKYGITALQKKCSSYLKNCLDDSNVCEVLVLADTHQDHDLKSCVGNFIQAHAQKILNSDSWKRFVESNPCLGYEIAHSIISNSF